VKCLTLVSIPLSPALKRGKLLFELLQILEKTV
jgi:hypothetical protein